MTLGDKGTHSCQVSFSFNNSLNLYKYACVYKFQIERHACLARRIYDCQFHTKTHSYMSSSHSQLICLTGHLTFHIWLFMMALHNQVHSSMAVRERQSAEQYISSENKVLIHLHLCFTFVFLLMLYTR